MTCSLNELAEGLSRLIQDVPESDRPKVPGTSASPEKVSEPSIATAPAPLPSTPEAGPVQFHDYNRKGYHLEALLGPSRIVAAAQWLDQHGFAIDTITGVDWIDRGQMELVYDFFHATTCCRVVLRVFIPRDQPEIPTISQVYPGANWHERETHDFFGIRFLGHPDLSPLLLPEDADYHPLRKDFAA